MTRGPLQRPNRPQPPQQNNPAIRRTNNNPPPRNPPPGGGGGGGNGNNPQPSPWLDPENAPKPDASAGFVEYLRWMRSPDAPQKDGTKVEILQKAGETPDYRKRLEQVNKRTQLLAREGLTFQVKSTWRIRVGGHRGPESILLPAFDALGTPYIPSSTLRGVARNQAIREVMANNNIGWERAEKEIAPYFGDLNPKDSKDKAGKVVFFDAYPLPSKNAGLEMDMANNIWSWEGDSTRYSPNPNPFFSLKEATFLIGLRLAGNCTDKKILEQVREWLVRGLKAGIGSQVNTGYGELIEAGKQVKSSEFYKLDFILEGQLIHGHQRFGQWQLNDRNGQWQSRGTAVAEVRPTAFKSMMRYWFRVFASGVLAPDKVRDTELKIFGGINPTREYGYLKVNIANGRVLRTEPRPNAQGKTDPRGEQQGTLVLSLSPEVPDNKEEAIKTLAKLLTWFMVNMGGIGQGARRPVYSRQNRERAPWFRGSTFYIDNDEDFWALANTVQGFKTQFDRKLKAFYKALGQVTGNTIDPNNLLAHGQASQRDWREAADKNCQIFVCGGAEQRGKPHALAILHSEALKVPNRSGQRDYDGDLCGKVAGGVKPSPVWVADLGDYQIVTVFGATADPRKKFINELKSKTAPNNFARIFPLSN